MAEVVWRVPSDVYQILVEILADMMEVGEETEDYALLLDQLKSLPDFPLQLNEDFDTLIVEEVGDVKSLPTVGVN
jgi:hypothetical protein